MQHVSLDQQLFEVALNDNGDPRNLELARELLQQGANPRYIGEAALPLQFLGFIYSALPIEYVNVRTSELGTDAMKRLLNQRCQKIA